MEAYQKLEARVGEWCQRPGKAVVCNSGTAALHLALEVGPAVFKSRDVLIPDFAFVACARAVTLADLNPVFMGCDRETGLISPDAVAAHTVINGPPYAIMAVHTYGRRCDMDKLADYANATDTWLVEDLAEAHGIPPHPRADAACWSFYKNKVVAGEEGGAVAFALSGRADHARSLRSLGATYARDYTHLARGHNYRMANVLAVPILESFRKYTNNLAGRRAAEAEYDRLCPSGWKMPPRDIPWVYDIRVPGITSDQQTEIVKALNERGILARHSFKMLSSQTEYKKCRVCKDVLDDREASLSREIIVLPLRPFTAENAHQAFQIVRRVLGGLPEVAGEVFEENSG